MDGYKVDDLIDEIRLASSTIERGNDLIGRRVDQVERSINEVMRRTGRPGAEHRGVDDSDERKDARDLCILKHELDVPKADFTAATFEPSPSQIDEALGYRRAFRNFWRHGDINRLDPIERKNLSSFSFGNNGFILSPEMSSTVLSCLREPTDLTGLVNRVPISGGSIKFLIDSVMMQIAGWACEASCFANVPNPDLSAIGELEIKAETLRHVVCANSDLLEDSSFPVQSWMLNKAAQAYRIAINNAVISGTGIGMPMGILNPNAGIPVCETSETTPTGQFSWADLIMLKWEIPQAWHAGASYLMNQRTFALLLTMSDAASRPIMIADPTQPGRMLINGSPIVIADQMPDCIAGSTPVAFGNWRQAYTIVDRRGTTVQPDPYSAGFCMLWRFSARLGGAVTCANMARLLRIR